MNMTRELRCVCIRGWESICGLYSQLFSKMTDFSRLGARESGSIIEIARDRDILTTRH